MKSNINLQERTYTTYKNDLIPQVKQQILLISLGTNDENCEIFFLSNLPHYPYNTCENKDHKQ